MNTKELKLFAGHYIDKQDIVVQEKIDLLNFIKAASDGQIYHMLVNGCIKENLSEEEITEAKMQFENSTVGKYLKENTKEKIKSIFQEVIKYEK